MKKLTAILLAAALAFSLTACGTGTSPKETASSAYRTASSAQETFVTEPAAASVNVYGKTFEQLIVGTDATDLSADIRILTRDTDLIGTTFRDYIAEFQKMYPNVTIVYEGYTSYDTDVPLLLQNDDWGDVCMIPSSMDRGDLAAAFLSYGSEEALSKTYRFVSEDAANGQVYGMPSGGAVNGIAYSRSVFEKAGITALPKTPDEFLADLGKIKEATGAIPLCTNYGIGSMISYWDTYIGVDSTGDAAYLYRALPDEASPFSDRKDGTGPYAVYSILYNAAKIGLIENTGSSPDIKKNESMLAGGEIGTMALDSRTAFELGKDVAYMPFPVTVNGAQYTAASPMGGYAINIHSTPENRLASMLYIKWLTESSGYSEDRGCIPVLIGAAYPDFLSAFTDTVLSSNLPAAEGQKVIFDTVNTDSGLFLMSDQSRTSELISAAGDEKTTFDSVMNIWNTVWANGYAAEIAVTPGA
jgi:raffinose/stachyose/melibiose transport system substrate-binding protein